MTYAEIKSLIDTYIQPGVFKGINAKKINELYHKLLDFSHETSGDFQGSAAPTDNPGTPSSPVYYTASVAGTYANFGGIVVSSADMAAGWVQLVYTGSAWTKTIVPINLEGYATIDSVSKKADLEYGVNIFNKDDSGILPGTAISLGGGTYPLSTYYTSYFMAVSPLTQYTIGFLGTMTFGRLGFYNASQIFISIEDIPNANPFTVSTPSGCAFIRFSATNASLVGMMVVLGATLPSTYQPYTIQVKTSQLPQLANYRDKATKITQPDLSFAVLTIGKNKFDLNDPDVALGYYVVDSNGNLSANPSYNSTGYISVIAGTSYTLSYKHNIAWYDASKVYVSGSPSTDKVKQRTAPVGAAFLRCTVGVAYWATFQVEEGTVETVWEAYDSYYFLEDVKTESVNSGNGATASNELLLYNNIFFLKGQENTIYLRNILDQKAGYVNDYFSTDSAVRNLGRGFRLYPTVNGNMTVREFDKQYKEISTKTVSYMVGDPAKDTGIRRIGAIGDSYTYAGYFLKRVKEVCPSLVFEGPRRPYGDGALKVTANGGWTMSLYFTRFFSLTGCYTMFMHPANPYKYWGNTDFWKKVANNNTEYGWAGHKELHDFLGGFSQTTGYRLTPLVNDLMWDDVAASMKEWNGTGWVNSAVSTGTFSFDYSKFLNQYGITAPDIVPILLGLNDFRGAASTGAVDTAFASFDAMMEIVIASIKVANPAAKIVIMTPATYCGEILNDGNGNVLLWERMMKYVRPKYFTEYANREGEGIYLCDAGPFVDPDYNFDKNSILPNAYYIGEVRVLETDNAPHPSTAGYYELGTALAGCIQVIR